MIMDEKNGKQLLSFIDNEDLYRQVERVIEAINNATAESEKRLHRNTVDPFSALFDSLYQGLTLRQWLEQEKMRQTQKTLQNAIGIFHQEIIGSVPGWINLGTGHVSDLKNDSLKIIAEVKNKYNTTKGNHKVSVYDDIAEQLKKNYIGYVGYYVEIIPNNKSVYNKPFTPSDNRTHQRRLEREDIRIVDGKSFYEIVTGDSEAIEKLYMSLPVVIRNILIDQEEKNLIYSSPKKTAIMDNGEVISKEALRRRKKFDTYCIEKDSTFLDLFKRAY